QDVLGKMIFAVDAERGRIHALPATTDQAGITAYLKDAELGDGAWAVAPVEYRPCPFLSFEVPEREGGILEREFDTGATDTSLPTRAIRRLSLEKAGTYAAQGIAGVHEGKTYKLRSFNLYGIEISTEIDESKLDYGLFGMDILRKL